MPFGHHLEQRRLHLGGCPVDLVGEQEVGHHRAEFGVELFAALTVDPGTDEVGRDEVGGELHPRERSTDHRRVGLDRQRLGHARNTFEQDVPPCEQADEDPLDQPVLSDDDPLDLEHGLLEQGDVGLGELEFLY